MNILSAFIAFDVLIIVYELLVEIFSALYQVSGLTKEQARFQVTSLLTLLTSVRSSNWTHLIIGLLISMFILILLYLSRRIKKIREGIDNLMLKLAEYMLQSSKK